MCLDGVIPINQTRKGGNSETQILRHNTAGNVYVVKDFTQKMCEMSPRQLVDYVQSNYIAILK